MPPKQQDKQPTDQAKQDRKQRKAAIAKQVMDVLGQLENLQRVQVHMLWEDRFRVNVLVGTDAVSIRVAHSFFLVTDGDGNILVSTPKITKQY